MKNVLHLETVAYPVNQSSYVLEWKPGDFASSIYLVQCCIDIILQSIPKHKYISILHKNFQN